MLLGGLVGLVWWWRRMRGGPRRRPRSRVRRVQIAAAALVLVLVGVGIVWRSRVASAAVSECGAPSDVQVASLKRQVDPPLLAEKVVTWPETGLGMLYANALGSSLCWYGPANYYVDFHSGRFAGARIMNVGDVVLAPPFDTRVHSGDQVADHEARHRSQWAVVTAIGGPLAFPVAYAVDDFFFPGSRNHFERMAGLKSGGYEHVGIGPVIGWPQLVVLLVAVALIAVLGYRQLRRGRPYTPARRQARHDQPG